MLQRRHAPPLPLPPRVCILPLVCRAFRHILDTPSAVLWPCLNFEVPDLASEAQCDRALSFLEWARRRGSRTPAYQLDFWNSGHAPAAGDACKAVEVALMSTLSGACVGWWGVGRQRRQLPRVASQRHMLMLRIGHLVVRCCAPTAVLGSCELLRLRWGGLGLTVGAWAAQASLSCIVLRWVGRGGGGWVGWCVCVWGGGGGEELDGGAEPIE